jgi:hypothetical protein
MQIFSAFLTLLTLALPCALAQRPQCSTLGQGWTDATTAFSLEAYTPTTGTSAPLYILNVEVVNPSAFHVISVSACHSTQLTIETYYPKCISKPWNNGSFSIYNFTTLTMNNGVINVYSPLSPTWNGAAMWVTVSVGTTKIDGLSLPYQTPGPWPTFVTHTGTPPAQQYCAVVSYSLPVDLCTYMTN